MKARELAQLLMQTPDYEVKVVTHSRTTWDNPFPKYEEFIVDDIDEVIDATKEVILGLY